MIASSRGLAPDRSIRFRPSHTGIGARGCARVRNRVGAPRLFTALLDPGEVAHLDVSDGRRAWIHVARGAVEVGGGVAWTRATAPLSRTPAG
jgi:redox-sensitive bicupin YhaK (pirin superfamily)